MSIKLVSTTDVKDFLEIDRSKITFDSLLDLLIRSNSKRVETYLNRDLKKESRTKYFNAGRTKYSLSAYPIDTSGTTTTALSVYDGSSLLTVNSDYYVWDAEGVIEFYTAPVYCEPRQIKIIWTGGYTEAITGEKLLSVPDDLRFACLLQTAYVFRRRNELGLQSISLADGSINSVSSGEFIPQVKGILKSYRRLATYDY